MSQPWEAEHTVTNDDARRLIETQFPQLRPLHVTPFGTGWDNAAFLVNDSMVFRFPRRQVGAECLKGEIQVLQHIADQLPLSIPRPEFVGEPDATFPWPFAGYPLIAGTTACRARLTIAQRERMIRPLAEFLAVLHAICEGQISQIGAPPDKWYRLDWRRRTPRTKERLEGLVGRGIVQYDESLYELLRIGEKMSVPANNALVHGDLYSRHLVVDTDHNLTGIIDWGDVHIGNPAVDLIVAFLLFPASMHDEFLLCYGAVDDDAWMHARIRAVHHTISVLQYAEEIGDDDLLRESLWAIDQLAGAV